MNLRKAKESELSEIWEILQYAIEQRRKDGSQQWQDGYPNFESVKTDFKNGYSYVIEDEDGIMAYAAIIFEEEPAYSAIEGKWLSDGEYLVMHRVAAGEKSKGKKIATKLFLLAEELALKNGVNSIKVDTNFDNVPMLKILDKLGYTYCGEVYFRGGARKAFEKLLS